MHPESNIVFHRMIPGAVFPMRADRSALGGMPAAAHQYCEALRSASAFGWYVFPPAEIQLKWDGADVQYIVDGEWQILRSAHLPGFSEYWDENCPEDFLGQAPPYLSSIFVPGVVQIWSGLLVSTAKDWSVLVRPPANLPQSRGFSCYEGIVETDWFKPCPLFVNIKLLATESPIEIPQFKPLFQLQPLHRITYGDESHRTRLSEGFDTENGLTEAEWAEFETTIRSTSKETK
jgi:Family of unknown function (DUF6065)